MLTPEEIKELKPKFEAIHHSLGVALEGSEQDITEEVCGHYITALLLMEELVEEITQKEGHSVKEAWKRVVGAANSPEGAGVAGGLGGAAAALSFTGLGGFGIGAGGTAVGMSGLAGATVASGGAALAGAAALYLAYKGGSAALETELGQKAAGHVADAGSKAAEQAKSIGNKATEGFGRSGSKAAEQAKSIGNKATEGFGRFRDRFSGSEPKDSSGA